MVPFKMLQRTPSEKMRANWFWSKEPETIFWIEGMRGCLWDIGANVGVYSLYAGMLGIKVFAFEPSKINYETLVANIELNGLTNVKAYKLAFSDKPGFNRFQRYEESGLSGGQLGEGEDVVNMVRGDALSIEKPDHIKIDVDGQEGNVLLGLSGMLREKRVKSLMIEANNYFEIFEIMRGFGYRETLINKGRVTSNYCFRR
jgi:FkbM family methyltransferase